MPIKIMQFLKIITFIFLMGHSVLMKITAVKLLISYDISFMS